MRRRDRTNLDLQGSNIKIVKSRGHAYYYYIMPSGELEPLGKNRKEAIEVAHALNLALRPSGDKATLILQKLNTPPEPIKLQQPTSNIMLKLLAEYDELILIGERKEPNLISRTESEKRYKLNKYKATWGERLISSISVQDIASFLNDLSKTSRHAYIKHRGLLKDLFAFAIQQGYRDTNPAAVTRTITAPERKKHRHTLEGYQAIRAIAPDWLQNAMDIALLSLQRRSDLTNLHRDQIDLEKNTILILQSKTRNYNEPIYIEIEMGEELRAAVDRCLNSGLDCPYLLNTKPLRVTKAIAAAKPHIYTITSDHLTKTFQAYRDKSGVYDHLDIKLRPSFHSLRALGIWLYEKAGYDDAYISALSGHATDRQLQAYKAGHEAPKPRKVSADLAIKWKT